MRALEARVARLETAVAELRHARSPAVSWLRLVRQLGTPADVACACGPCRADLEDQLLAYGAEACRLTEQGAARLQTEASQNPVRLLAAVLTYPPGQEAPRDIVAHLGPSEFDPQRWRNVSCQDGGYYFWASYRRWLYCEVLHFVCPDPTARRLRERLHGPGYAPAALVQLAAELELWPAGLYTFLAYGFQEPRWWEVVGRTGLAPPASFFAEPEEPEEEEQPTERLPHIEDNWQDVLASMLLAAQQLTPEEATGGVPEQSQAHCAQDR
jgi:hypothetical protein